MLQAPKPESSYTLAPAGTHIARLYEIIHIGTIADTYQGQPTESNKIRLTFELPEEKKVFKENQEAKPIVISQEYTFSMGAKANLRKLVEGIIGTSLKDEEAYGFDIESLISQSCLLTIKHRVSSSGNSYSVIASASPLMKNQIAPKAINDVKILSYSNWNQELFEGLPEFLKDKIKSSQEYTSKFTSSLSTEEKEVIRKKKEELNNALKIAQEQHDSKIAEDTPF